MANLRTNNLSGEQGQNAYRGSVYFPGYVNGAASSYLSIADNDDLDIGTGDFTFEAWIRPVKHAGTNNPNFMGFFSSADYGSSGSITIQVKNDGKLRYVAGNVSGTYDDETGSTVLWGHYHHVAIVRSGSTIKGYVNGVEEISSSYSSAIDFGTGGSTVIGELAIDNYAGDYPFRGYISNLRLVKGTAVYTSAFTPPTSELTIIPNTVLLCCQNSDDPTQEATGKTITANGITSLVNRTDNLIKNGRFTTSATQNWTLSGGTAVLSTGQSSAFGDGNHVALTATSSYAYLKQSFTTVIGRTYRTDGLSNGGDASFISTSTSEDDAVVTDIRGGKTFIATQTTHHVILRGNTGGANFDTISVHELENSVQPKVIPPVGRDAGNTFGGPIQQSSEGYMYFPTGRTEERGRGRGLIMGYYIAPANYNTCEFITIQSLGNSQDFGDMSQASRGHFSFGSSTRAIRGGGYVAPANVNVIEFFTIATQSNATDFGDITNQSHLGSYAPISNETRGIFAGGYSYPATFNNIDFVTIASLGNSQDFGGLTTLRADGNRSQVNSSTRGLIGGGYISPTGTNNIEFLTIATTGDSQDFGDLTQGRGNFSGLCSNTRGVFAGGTNPSNNIIDFVTIASTGNATDFGDLIDANSGAMSATSNNTRGVIVGGDQQPANYYVNTMQFVTIATTGNAQDFGDALTAKSYMGMTSDSHGGLS